MTNIKLPANSKLAVLCASAFAAVIITGCQNPQVMAEREIIPAAQDEIVADIAPMENIQINKPLIMADNNNIEKPVINPPLATPPPMKPRATTPINNISEVASGSSYTIRKGDTLSRIAKRHNISYIALAKHNNMSVKDKIYPGKKLLIPGKSKGVKIASKGNKSSHKTTNAAKKPANGIYTVKSGDSLWKIAKRFKTNRSAIASANNIDQNSILRIGQKLKIPDAKALTATAVKNPVNKTTNKTASSTTDKKVIETKTATTTTAAVVTTEDDDNLDIISDSFEIKTDIVPVEADASMSELAKLHNVSVQKLCEANPGSKPETVYEKGEVIYVPIK